MKCSRCGREIPEKESYTHEGKPVCEGCLMKLGRQDKDICTPKPNA